MGGYEQGELFYLIDNPIKFFERLSEKYMFLCPELSVMAKETENMERERKRNDENSYIRKLIDNVEKKKERDSGKDKKPKISLWD